MIIVILSVLGLALGSFVNALVWRLRQQSLPIKKRAVKKSADLSIAKGRSMCTSCGHTLNGLDLVPLLSWVFLGGKCRYCHVSISPQYPLIELLTALVFVLSYLAWPFDLVSLSAQLVFASWLLAVVAMIALIVYDIRWMLLPNKIVFPLIGLGIVITLVRAVEDPNALHSLIQSILSLAVAGGIFYVLFQISDGQWIGGGDVKLGFALGLLLGTPIVSFLMLFIASLLGLFVALAPIVRRKAVNRRIPFGPFLITSTVICMLYGAKIIDWYSTTFLYL